MKFVNCFHIFNGYPDFIIANLGNTILNGNAIEILFYNFNCDMQGSVPQFKNFNKLLKMPK